MKIFAKSQTVYAQLFNILHITKDCWILFIFAAVCLDEVWDMPLSQFTEGSFCRLREKLERFLHEYLKNRIMTVRSGVLEVIKYRYFLHIHFIFHETLRTNRRGNAAVHYLGERSDRHLVERSNHHLVERSYRHLFKTLVPPTILLNDQTAILWKGRITIFLKRLYHHLVNDQTAILSKGRIAIFLKRLYHHLVERSKCSCCNS